MPSLHIVCKGCERSTRVPALVTRTPPRHVERPILDAITRRPAVNAKGQPVTESFTIRRTVTGPKYDRCRPCWKRANGGQRRPVEPR